MSSPALTNTGTLAYQRIGDTTSKVGKQGSEQKEQRPDGSCRVQHSMPQHVLPFLDLVRHTSPEAFAYGPTKATAYEVHHPKARKQAPSHLVRDYRELYSVMS